MLTDVLLVPAVLVTLELMLALVLHTNVLLVPVMLVALMLPLALVPLPEVLLVPTVLVILVLRTASPSRCGSTRAAARSRTAPRRTANPIRAGYNKHGAPGRRVAAGSRRNGNACAAARTRMLTDAHVVKLPVMQVTSCCCSRLYC